MNAINTTIRSQNSFFSPSVSLSQVLTTASKIDVVFPSTQTGDVIAFPFGILSEIPVSPIDFNPDLTTPRLPGSGKGRILRVDPNFDAAIDMGI